MAQQSSRRIVVFCASAIALAVVLSWNPLAAQAPAKRPLSYDIVDSWRSIQGTRLSQDGQWLAYALTAPGDDGELVVRNLKTNQDLKSPRGTSPTFTPDGKFVIFTIVPTKAEDERANRGQGAATPAAAPAGGRAGGAGGDASRNSLGIMSLPGGQVTTIEQVATFRLPEESSTWLAYHKARAGGGRGAGGGGGRAGAATPAAAPPAAQAGSEGETAATANEKRKDAGTDLIVRNLST